MKILTNNSFIFNALLLEKVFIQDFVLKMMPHQCYLNDAEILALKCFQI